MAVNIIAQLGFNFKKCSTTAVVNNFFSVYKAPCLIAQTVTYNIFISKSRIHRLWGGVFRIGLCR